MIELKKHVEEAVRPLRATARRKLQMREELLAHLNGLYEEEMTKTDNSVSAVRAALTRFGQSGPLAKKLQASVPTYDRWRSRLENLYLPGSKSWWGLALWWTVGELILLTAVIVGMSIWLSGITRLEIFAVLILSILVMPAIFVGMFAMAGSLIGVLGHVRSAKRTVLYGIGLACFWMVLGFLLFANDGLATSEVAYIVTICVLSPFAFAFIGYVLGNEIKRQENAKAQLAEWESIELTSR